MTDKAFVDAAQPATLNNGAGELTDYPTLQEAVMAWHRLPPEQTRRATIKMIDGPSLLRLRLRVSTTDRSRRDKPSGVKFWLLAMAGVDTRHYKPTSAPQHPAHSPLYRASTRLVTAGPAELIEPDELARAQ